MKTMIFLFVLIAFNSLNACTDDWDKHYHRDNETDEGVENNLGEYLNLQEKYSRYVAFLKETHVWDTLNADQILTVWAVADENMPSAEELSRYNTYEKKQIALNMMNYMPIYYPKFKDGKKIQTMAGKNIFMTMDHDGYLLDGVKILSTNQVCKNGVVHELGNVIFPRKNLYEYIENLPDDYSMLRDSLLARNDTVFDIENSFPVNVDATGNTVYDSVFVIRNDFIGSIRNEESEHTLMLCSNEVILGAFKEIKEYLLTDTLTEELEEEMNDWWLKALIYPEKITDYNKDKSIYSIYNKHWRTDIQSVDKAGATPVSNGMIYPVDRFIFPKSSLLKDVEYIIPDIWQRVSQEERQKYFSYGGKGYTTSPSEIIYTDGQLNNNPWAQGISNTWWRANSTRNQEQDTVYAEFTLLEQDMKNKIQPIRLYPGTYDVEIWIRSYGASPITITVVSDAVEGAQKDSDGNYKLVLQEQAKQDKFSQTDVKGSYYQGKVGTITLTKPTQDLRFNFLIWEKSSNKNINIRGIKLTANREEMY